MTKCSLPVARPVVATVTPALATAGPGVVAASPEYFLGLVTPTVVPWWWWAQEVDRVPVVRRLAATAVASQADLPHTTAGMLCPVEVGRIGLEGAAVAALFLAVMVVIRAHPVEGDVEAAAQATTVVAAAVAGAARVVAADRDGLATERPLARGQCGRWRGQGQVRGHHRAGRETTGRCGSIGNGCSSHMRYGVRRRRRRLLQRWRRRRWVRRG